MAILWFGAPGPARARCFFDRAGGEKCSAAPIFFSPDAPKHNPGLGRAGEVPFAAAYARTY
jgi:hypothetical protein